MTDDLQWYAARDGHQIGPFSRDKLGVLLATGQLKPSDFIWQEGWPQWSPVGAFLEHSGAQRIAAKFSAAKAGKSQRHWGAIHIALSFMGLIGALGAALLSNWQAFF